MCLYPKLIKNRKYLANKKNGGNIPTVTDDRVLYVPVGCGKCIECMKQRKREWQIRLHEEIRHDNTGKFVTLTFSDEALNDLYSLPFIRDINDNYLKDNEVATVAVRRFLERWRKDNKKSVKHWLVTELGHTNTERIHLHGLLFTDKDEEYISKKWSYGFIFVGHFVNEKTINYIVKYINKQDFEHKNYKPKILTSRGIGKGYFNRSDFIRNKYKGTDTITTYRNKQGLEMALPIYYRNKIYSEDEREKLWLDLLDKEERWVCGERIDISESDEEYWKALEYYREYNKKLGYGDDKITFDEKQYKSMRSRLKIKNKLKKNDI
jgi:hypothetical protein